MSDPECSEHQRKVRPESNVWPHLFKELRGELEQRLLTARANTPYSGPSRARAWADAADTAAGEGQQPPGVNRFIFRL